MSSFGMYHGSTHESEEESEGSEVSEDSIDSIHKHFYVLTEGELDDGVPSDMREYAYILGDNLSHFMHEEFHERWGENYPCYRDYNMSKIQSVSMLNTAFTETSTCQFATLSHCTLVGAADAC